MRKSAGHAMRPKVEGIFSVKTLGPSTDVPALGPAGPEVGHEQLLKIGPFRITPYLLDHSAFDGYAFLVESEGECQVSPEGSHPFSRYR
ncbi:MAG: hypothetical protein Q8N51_20315 [Gammaproteobacteria bacterium]|nr:hypothetical protein [Gammaproteobacteria bacterium]